MEDSIAIIASHQFYLLNFRREDHEIKVWQSDFDDLYANTYVRVRKTFIIRINSVVILENYIEERAFTAHINLHFI